MIKRFPDIARIVIKAETEVVGSPFPNVTQTTIENLEGRYEPQHGSKELDYKGKYYCNILPVLIGNAKVLDGQRFFLNGATDFIGIVGAHNYQTHCEIWLD